MKSKSIFAIESSCDETSTCFFVNKPIKELTLSSINSYKKIGGIIPEIASRAHEVNFPYCLAETLPDTAPDLIAYTEKPGMPGPLLIGKTVAKTLSVIYKCPLLPINHIHGHIFSPFINQKPSFPFLSLVVSGGHTAIYLVEENLQIIQLISTPDDAVGEVLDKVGRELGFSYPAGPKIDKAYKEELANIKLISKNSFSFSGLKTASMQLIKKQTKISKKDKISISSSLNKTIVSILIFHLKSFIEKYKPKMIAIGGGVAANNLLRKEIKNLNLLVAIPELKYCQDNATMIAVAANFIINKKNSNKYI